MGDQQHDGASHSQTGIVAAELDEAQDRGRPLLRDLQQHQSTSILPSEDHPSRTRARHGRSSSAGTPIRAQSRFTSPDRFIPQRPLHVDKRSSYQTAKSYTLVQGQERDERRRDELIDPFRSASETRSESLARQRQGYNAYNLRPPRYTPSFVRNADVSSMHPDGQGGFAPLRRVSGGFWTVGGQMTIHLGQLQGVTSATGGLIASGTTAPLHPASFLNQDTSDDQTAGHERRLALALDIDQRGRILPQTSPSRENTPNLAQKPHRFEWRDNSWTRHATGPFLALNSAERRQSPSAKFLPSVPFRVLDAPHMKDDYYCNVLAYSHTCHTLAVALEQKVFLWNEQYGVRHPPLAPTRNTNFVISLAFSSETGGKAILAVARNGGTVTLWSLLEARPRFEAPHSYAATCLAWRPTVTHRVSVDSDEVVPCEDLLVGDDSGNIYYYSLEWPEHVSGSMSLLAKVDAHTQNVCGLAWSPDGELFVSGGNDNQAFLYDPKIIIETQNDMDSTSIAVETPPLPATPISRSVSITSGLLTPPESAGRRSPRENMIADVIAGPSGHTGIRGPETPPPSPTRRGRSPGRLRAPNGQWSMSQDTPLRNGLPPVRNGLADPCVPGLVDVHVYSFYHSAAVKAIAFAPWQPSLLATGGGSNDRQIHFFHTGSGVTLALINVFSQVTSLVWSTTRREVAATFGYSQPEHEIRIAVFSWPSCECVVSIPWERKQDGELPRALWAIPYPGGPNDATSSRRRDNSSDGSSTWETVQERERQRRIATAMTPRRRGSPAPGLDAVPRTNRSTTTSTSWSRPRDTGRRDLRGEGEPWASRTEEEGSLIIACCDSTVKFFEVWAGKSKGKGRGLGNRDRVLGGSRVLEGWCERVGVDEIDSGEVIR
ncbi:hypothetical protein LTS17_008669 [Exophiala oligosperma]